MINKKKNVLIILLSMFTNFIYSQKTNQEEKNPIIDLPDQITFEYRIDIIPDKETALKYADIILKSRYINTKIDELKTYEIELTTEGKVW